MNRRNFIANSTAALAAAGLSATLPLTLNAQESSKKTKLVHFVLFWLKPNLSESQIKEFTGFFEQLKTIPTVKSLQYGPAASTPQRDVVDNSFSFAMSATFKSVDDHNLYQKDPIHLEAVEKFSHLWTKVVVHDALM